MTSQQDTELEEILYDYWAKHRDCKDGCQHMNQGEDTIQALTSWKDKEVIDVLADIQIETMLTNKSDEEKIDDIKKYTTNGILKRTESLQSQGGKNE